MEGCKFTYEGKDYTEEEILEVLDNESVKTLQSGNAVNFTKEALGRILAAPTKGISTVSTEVSKSSPVVSKTKNTVIKGDSVATTTVTDVINNTEVNETTRPFLNLLKVVAQHEGIGDTEINLVDNLEATYTDPKNKKKHVSTTAVYDTESRAIYLSENFRTLDVVVHEAVHAATSRYLDANPTSAKTKELENIFNKVKEYAETNGIKNSQGEDFYGLTDIHEFLAETHSDIEFQLFLQSVPYTSKRSVWDIIIQWASELLGVDSDLIRDIMQLSTEIAALQVEMDASNFNVPSHSVTSTLKPAKPKGMMAQLAEDLDAVVPDPMYIALEVDKANKKLGDYKEQLARANPTQRSVMDKLARMNAHKESSTETKYSLITGESVNRFSFILNQDPRFAFSKKEVENDFNINAHWGNQLDDILSYVLSTEEVDLNLIRREVNKKIQERNIEDSATEELVLKDEVIKEVINEAVKLKQKYPNDVFMTQMFLVNKGSGIGGTADVLKIDRTGEIKVIDIKSSINRIAWNGKYYEKNKKKEYVGGRIVDSIYDYAYDKEYTYSGVNKASKKARHEAQLSTYIGILKSKGFNVSDTGDVLGLHIQEVDENSVVGKVEAEYYEDTLEQNEQYEDIAAQDGTFLILDLSPYKAKTDLIMDKIKLAMNDRISLLKDSSAKDKEFAIRVYKSYMNNLSEIDAGTTIESYIQIIYQAYVEDKFGNNELDRLNKDILSGKFKANPLQAIQLINEYRTQYQNIEPILSALKDLYDKMYLEQGASISAATAQEGSPLYKLQKINENVDSIKTALKSSINESLTNVLAEQLDAGAVEKVQKEYEHLLTIQAVGTNTYQGKHNLITAPGNNSLEARVARLREKLNNKPDDKGYARQLAKEMELVDKKIRTFEERLIVSKESIAQMLEDANFNDISVLGNWMVTAASSSNPLISLFVKKVKEGLEDIRVQHMKIQHANHAAFVKYRDKAGVSSFNVAEFNEGLFETVMLYNAQSENEDKLDERVALVQENDYTKFNKAFSAAMKKFEIMHGGAHTPEYRKAKEQWEFQNRRELPDEDQTITINGETVVIQRGVTSIVQEKKRLLDEGHITKSLFNEWVSKAFITDNQGKRIGINVASPEGRELSRPSKAYESESYKKLKENPAKFEYYQFLVHAYFRAQQDMPDRYVQEKYVLPSIEKEGKDMFAQNFRESGGKGLVQYGKFVGKSLVGELASDEEIYGDGRKAVPKLYTRYMPVNEVSLDLISSITRFGLAASKYKVLSKMASIGELLYDRASESKATKTSDGLAKMRSTAEKLGLRTFEKYQDSTNNLVADLLRNFIDMQIYGKMKQPNVTHLFGKRIDINKAVGLLESALAHTSLGGIQGGISAMANYLQGNTMNLLEAHAGQFYNKKNLLKAKKQYVKFEGSFLKDRQLGINKSFIGQLIDLFDPMQGNFVDEFGHTISQNMFKQMWSKNTWFFLHNQQEHRIQINSLLAHLDATTVKDANGKEIPLFEAYELGKDGIIKVKEGIDLKQLGRVDSSGLLPLQIQGRIHGVNRSLHGNYAKFNATKASSTLLGRSFEFYRKYFVTGLMKRFEQSRFDAETDEITEGYYRTFFNNLIRDVKGTTKIAFGITTKADGSGYTELEIANARRAAIELAIVALLSAIGTVLTAAIVNCGDDLEKKRKYLVILYPLVRLQSEMMVYFPISRDTLRVIKNPSIAFSYVTKAVDLAQSAFEDVGGLATGQGIGRYKRDTSIWNKGTSKTWAKFVKMFGITGSKFDFEEALKVLELKRL